jgi:hypothetical protein
MVSTIATISSILPSDQTENVKALIEQLITWSPTTKGKTDMVMALWFCEIRAREMLNQGMHKTHHLKEPIPISL